VTIAGYRILGELGSSAHGVVHRAEKNGREVALKVIEEPDATRAAALLDAARAAARIVHPAVARTFAAGRDGDRVWIAMEHVAGRSLAERLDEGPLPVADVVRVLAAACGALDAAHAAGVLHCGLKPRNILVGDVGVKVTDFGVAAARDRRSAPYASPEAAHGYAIDARSDLYSLGVLAVELLTGAAYEDAVDAPLVLPADVPPVVRSVIIRLLHKDQGARFRTAAAVAAALAPAPARPRSLRWLLGVAVVAVAAVVIVLLVRGRGAGVGASVKGAAPAPSGVAPASSR
jgi:serine/threonine protein kinase